MTSRLRRFVGAACIAVCMGPFDGLTRRAAAAESGGQINGIVTARAGRPASGWDVLLVSLDGDLVAHAATTRSGAYEFKGVPPGRYRLGVRDSTGKVGPVAGPDAVIATGVRVRQDVRLVASSAPRLSPAAYGARESSWWDRQTENQKAFFVVGIVAGGAALLAILDDVTNDNESPASPY